MHDKTVSNLLAQHETSNKILAFQERAYFKTVDLEALAITPSEWLLLITRFELQNLDRLSERFFLLNLSAIRKVSPDDLLNIIKKSQPKRAAKRSLTHAEHSAPSKKRYCKYIEDYGTTPFIGERDTQNPTLDENLENAGVRMVESLADTSPVKGYPIVKQTPGGSKARAVFTSNGHTFYKHLTPIKAPDFTGRVKIGEHSQEEIQSTMPKLKFARAVSIEYIATLDSIQQRSGLKRRYSARTLTGASAADVFRAHGVEVSPKYSQSHHWAHLIAHFLTDETQISAIEKSDKEVINLVPATSAANYNTLEAIELFIRDKLVGEETEQIHIRVEPYYSDENLIPDMLVYNLNWQEVIVGRTRECKETFYINPQSYLRFTKSMHRSIDVLRKSGDEMDVTAQPTPELKR